jgi:hypothetical protein
MATLAGSFAARAGVIVTTPPPNPGGSDDTHASLPYAGTAILTNGDAQLAVDAAATAAPPASAARAGVPFGLAIPFANGVDILPSIAAGLSSLGAILADLHRQRFTVLRL